MQLEVIGRSSYEKLILVHIALLRRWVGSKVHNQEDAEDVLQQTLLLGMRHFDQFRFEASFATWLCRIALNVIRGQYRRPYDSRTVLTDPKTLESLQPVDTRHSALYALEKDQVRTTLRRAISQLPSISRSCRVKKY